MAPNYLQFTKSVDVCLVEMVDVPRCALSIIHIAILLLSHEIYSS